MKRVNWFGALAAGAVLTTLLACGGGSTDSDDPAAAAGSRPVVASGAISGFGSVFVNGIRFDTSAAEIEIDGARGTESDLRVGQMVRIEGRLNSDGSGGSASRIDRRDIVEGPVQSVDVAAGSLVVLGQTVNVDENTSFDDRLGGNSLAAVTVGSTVEVSGLRDAQGDIRATRIEPQRAGDDFEVLGTVAAHDAVSRRFRIEALTVDYRTAQLDDLSGGAIADGLLVEVHGTTLDAGGALVATRVEGKRPGIGADDDDEARVAGVITRFVSPADFDVSGQAVTTDAATRFEGGSAANLALNVNVQVEGTIDGAVLRASKVKFQTRTDVRVSATVDSVDAANRSFTVLGILVLTTSGTRVEDKTDAQLRPFTVADLRAGDFVEVRGTTGATANSIAASRVERDDPEDRVELRGPATDVAQPQLKILGVIVMTNAQTDFENEGDADIDADAFFAAAVANTVKAQGQMEGDVLVAREIEIED